MSAAQRDPLDSRYEGRARKSSRESPAGITEERPTSRGVGRTERGSGHSRSGKQGWPRSHEHATCVQMCLQPVYKALL